MLRSDDGAVDGSESTARSRPQPANTSASGSNARLQHASTSTSLTASGIEHALEWDSSFDYVRYQQAQQFSNGDEPPQQPTGSPAPTAAPQPTAQCAETDANLAVASGDSSRSDRTNSTVVTIRRQVSFPIISLKRAGGVLDGLRGLTILFEGDEKVDQDTSQSLRTRSEASFCSLAPTEPQCVASVGRRASRVSHNTEYASLSERLSGTSAVSQPPQTVAAIMPARPQPQPPTPRSQPAPPTSRVPPSIEKCARWLARHELQAAAGIGASAGDGDGYSAGPTVKSGHATDTPSRQNNNRRGHTLSDRPATGSTPFSQPAATGRSRHQSEDRPSGHRSDRQPRPATSDGRHQPQSGCAGRQARPSVDSRSPARAATTPRAVRKSVSAPIGPAARQLATPRQVVGKSRSAHAGSATGLTKHGHAQAPARGGETRASRSSESAASASAPCVPSLHYLNSVESDDLIRRWRQDRKDFYQLAYLWNDAGERQSPADDSGFSSSVLTHRAPAPAPAPPPPSPPLQVYTASVQAPTLPSLASRTSGDETTKPSAAGLERPVSATVGRRSGSGHVAVLVAPREVHELELSGGSNTPMVTTQHAGDPITAQAPPKAPASQPSGSNVRSPSTVPEDSRRTAVAPDENRRMGTAYATDDSRRLSTASATAENKRPSSKLANSESIKLSRVSALADDKLLSARSVTGGSKRKSNQNTITSAEDRRWSTASASSESTSLSSVSAGSSARRPSSSAKPLNSRAATAALSSPLGGHDTASPAVPSAGSSARRPSSSVNPNTSRAATAALSSPPGGHGTASPAVLPAGSGVMPARPPSARAAAVSARPPGGRPNSGRRRSVPLPVTSTYAATAHSSVHFSPSALCQREDARRSAAAPLSRAPQPTLAAAPRLSSMRGSTFILSDGEKVAAAGRRLAAGPSRPAAAPPESNHRSVSPASTSESRHDSDSGSCSSGSELASTVSVVSPRPADVPVRPSTSPVMRPSSFRRMGSGVARGRPAAIRRARGTAGAVQPAGAPTARGGATSRVTSSSGQTTAFGGRQSAANWLTGRSGNAWSHRAAAAARGGRPATLDSGQARRGGAQRRPVPQPPRPLSADREPNMRRNQPPPRGYRFTPDGAAPHGGPPPASDGPRRSHCVTTHLDIVIQTDESDTQSPIEMFDSPTETVDNSLQTDGPNSYNSHRAPRAVRQLPQLESDDTHNDEDGGGAGTHPLSTTVTPESVSEEPAWRGRPRGSSRTHHRVETRPKVAGGRPGPSRGAASTIPASVQPSDQPGARRSQLNSEIESAGARPLRHIGSTGADSSATRLRQVQDTATTGYGDYSHATHGRLDDRPDCDDQSSASECDSDPPDCDQFRRRIVEKRLPAVRDTIRDYEVRSRSASRERLPSPQPQQSGAAAAAVARDETIDSADEHDAASDGEGGDAPFEDSPGAGEGGATNTAAAVRRPGNFRHSSGQLEPDSVEYRPGQWREFGGEDSPASRPPRSRIPVRRRPDTARSQWSTDQSPPAPQRSTDQSPSAPRRHADQSPPALQRSTDLSPPAPRRYAGYELNMQEQQGSRRCPPPLPKQRSDDHRTNRQTRPSTRSGGGRMPADRPHPWPPPQGEPVPDIVEARRRAASARQQPQTPTTATPSPRRLYSAGSGGRTVTPRYSMRPTGRTTAPGRPSRGRPASSPRPQPPGRAASAAATADTPSSDRSSSSGGAGCDFCTLGYSEAELLQARLVRRRPDNGCRLRLTLDGDGAFDGGRAVVRRLRGDAAAGAEGHTQTDEFAHINSLLQLDLFPCETPPESELNKDDR